MKKLALIFGVYVATFFVGVLFVVFLNIARNKPTVLVKPQIVKTKIDNIEVFEEAIKDSKTEIEGFVEKVEPNYRIKLLTTGNFHGEEVSAKTGENWIGLFKDGDKYYLKNSIIKVKRIYDEVIDKTGEKTGKQVSVKGSKEPIILLKNSKILKNGKVPTLFKGMNYYEALTQGDKNLAAMDKMTYLHTGFSHKYKFDVEQKLSVIKGKLRRNETNHLILEEGTKLQILDSDMGGDEYLLWVGDLDNDNKPDFLFNLSKHYNISNLTLFLSSEAEKGNLVKKVAVFETYGC